MKCKMARNHATLKWLNEGFCGDGTRNGSEECDYQHMAVESCRDYGGGAGMTCQPNCMLDISQCKSKAVDLFGHHLRCVMNFIQALPFGISPEKKTPKIASPLRSPVQTLRACGQGH